MNAETTTKFKGDIVFNDGENDILVSDLATVEEVNEALTQCVTNDKVDTYTKMWMSTEPTEPLYLNPNFEYKDDHVMSSKAVKELIPDISEYRKKDDLQFGPVKQEIEVVHNEDETRYAVKGYDPNLPITITFIWNDQEITAITGGDNTNGQLYTWKPLTEELQAKYNIIVLYVRGTNGWNDPDNIDLNSSEYTCSLFDCNYTPSYPKVISAYQVIKEADELVLKSQLDELLSKIALIENQLKRQEIINEGYEFLSSGKVRINYDEKYILIMHDIDLDKEQQSTGIDLITIEDDNGTQHRITYLGDKTGSSYEGEHNVAFDGEDQGGYIEDQLSAYLIYNSDKVSLFAHGNEKDYVVDVYRKRTN